MSSHHGLDGLMEFAFGDDCFDSFFRNGFDFAYVADKGMRPFMGFKTAFSLGRKRTVAVVADIAGTGVGQSLAYDITVACWDVNGNFIELVFGDRYEAL